MTEIIFLTGAAGSGKTTAIKTLETSDELNMPLLHSDDYGVPSPDEMVAQYGGGMGYQRHILRHYINEIQRSYPDDRTLLEGSFQPILITEICADLDVKQFKVILFDCIDTVRAERLVKRGHPELVTDNLMQYATMLREQAEANDFSRIDTTQLSPAECVSTLVELVKV